jgi:hypothetical protein
VASNVIVVPNARTAATIIKKVRMVISRLCWLAKQTKKGSWASVGGIKNDQMRSGFTRKE